MEFESSLMAEAVGPADGSGMQEKRGDCCFCYSKPTATAL